MQALRDAGVGEVAALCGGNCSCATCHVYVEDVDPGLLPPMSRDEDDLLEGSFYRKPTSKLSCQLPFSTSLNGARITIALPTKMSLLWSLFIRSAGERLGLPSHPTLTECPG